MSFPHLDIIIPQYNEDEKVIKPLLTSIENQVGLNFSILNVTIVNDHSDCKLSQEFLNSFAFPITYLETDKNGGAGYARQWGIDHTSNPLIMFCDADDRFYDIKAIAEIYQWIRMRDAKQQPWQILNTSFYEEYRKDQAWDIIKHEKPTPIWMHGKVWKREFLVNNNIRFHETLRTFEDTYFGRMAFSMCKPAEQGYLPYYTYFWTRNPNSVTSKWNHDGKDYLFWNHYDYITCHGALTKALNGKCATDKQWIELTLPIVYFTYLILQFNEYQTADEETIKRVQDLTDFEVAIITEFNKSGTKPLQDKTKAMYYATCRQAAVEKHDFTTEKIKLNSFLQMLQQMYDVDTSYFMIN